MDILYIVGFLIVLPVLIELVNFTRSVPLFGHVKPLSHKYSSNPCHTSTVQTFVTQVNLSYKYNNSI
jgi:hypothetical protein